MKRPSFKLEGTVLAAVLFALALVASFDACMPLATDDTVVYQTYVPPPWAPPYDGISQIRYYYFPDYEMFYDVWEGVFCYQSGEVWICSPTLPPMYADIDLYGTFIVLVHRDLAHPWDHYRYFERNYPRHCYEQYGPIVEHNRVVPPVPRERRLVPRAFNENSNRVTFMQQSTDREPHPAPNPTPPGTPLPIAAPQPHYDREAQEVPMRAITPSMPAASKGFNYGSGYSKPPSSVPSQSAPRAPSAQPAGQPSGQRAGQPAGTK